MPFSPLSTTRHQPTQGQGGGHLGSSPPPPSTIERRKKESRKLTFSPLGSFFLLFPPPPLPSSLELPPMWGSQRHLTILPFLSPSLSLFCPHSRTENNPKKSRKREFGPLKKEANNLFLLLFESRVVFSSFLSPNSFFIVHLSLLFCNHFSRCRLRKKGWYQKILEGEWDSCGTGWSK